jgi:hypothetical protein
MRLPRSLRSLALTDGASHSPLNVIASPIRAKQTFSIMEGACEWQRLLCSLILTMRCMGRGLLRPLRCLPMKGGVGFVNRAPTLKKCHCEPDQGEANFLNNGRCLRVAEIALFLDPYNEVYGEGIASSAALPPNEGWGRICKPRAHPKKMSLRARPGRPNFLTIWKVPASGRDCFVPCSSR